MTLVASDRDLNRASTGTFDDRIAFFPENHSFYLRIYVGDEALHSNDPQWMFEGDFDVTCQEPLAAQLVDVLEQVEFPVLTEPAKAFFDRCYDR